MKLMELPPGFGQLALTGAERQAVLRFLNEAPLLAPKVALLAPRRSSAGHLKLVADFPDGDTWAMTQALVALSQRIHLETGVYLHLD